MLMQHLVNFEFMNMVDFYNDLITNKLHVIGPGETMFYYLMFNVKGIRSHNAKVRSLKDNNNENSGE